MKKADLIKKQSRVLNYTANHYTSKNRCATSSNSCKYYPTHAETKGCAVGRLVKSKKLCKLLDEQNDSSVGGIFNLLPKEVKVLGVDFLADLQSLHDSDMSFVKNGITKQGIEKAVSIAEQYGLTLKIKKIK